MATNLHKVNSHLISLGIIGFTGKFLKLKLKFFVFEVNNNIGKVSQVKL